RLETSIETGSRWRLGWRSSNDSPSVHTNAASNDYELPISIWDGTSSGYIHSISRSRISQIL
ncbi:hypothetical protein FRC19_010913, partial [Serendipita sp. 401]